MAMESRMAVVFPSHLEVLGDYIGMDVRWVLR
ncbi:hypothetical protein HU200_002877 [Digitaria exilis]|uniref:Uncharacterized protein n=1 Tax=Digitaria exilis TaxID=1010633 RepID=A0A835KV42_9POAL|nr:hypothetical protein HU200_002877 [Digitaria exilis]